MALVSGGRKSFEVDGGLAQKAADETRRIFVHFQETDLCRPVVDQVEVRLVGPSRSWYVRSKSSYVVLGFTRSL